MKFNFGFGDTLRDTTTGFRGVVMARAEYSMGNKQYALCSKSLHNGKPVGLIWLDETRLVRVRRAKKK